MTIPFFKSMAIAMLLFTLAGCSGGGGNNGATGGEDTTIAGSPAEDPPAEDPPAEDPPAEDPPAEDPPAEDPPAEDPPAEDPPAEDPPAAPEAVQGFTLSFEAIKVFRFNWSDAEGATHYHLLENPDGISGFTRLVEDIPKGNGTLEVQVPLHARTNALYILQACNKVGEQDLCTDSTSLSVNDTLVESIGYFKASNTGIRDVFGVSIALSADGHTLAVGATLEESDATGFNGDQENDDGVNPDGTSPAGAVYVFTQVDNAWVQEAYIKASNNNGGGLFGVLDLSGDGNTLAVGAFYENSGTTGINGDQTNTDAPQSGAVYVFTRLDGAWTQNAYIKASNTSPYDLFGRSLSLSDDGRLLAVGAPFEDSSTTGINGDQTDPTVILGIPDESGTWQIEDNNESQEIGNTVNSGAVYVFSHIDDTWVQEAYIKASNTGLLDEFGISVSLSGDGTTMAVGATGEDSKAVGINGEQSNDDALYSGACYVFSRTDGNWAQQAYIKASNSDYDDEFGLSVDLSANGNILAVGANNEDSNAIGTDGDLSNNAAKDSGAAYVFARADGQWAQQAYLKASNSDASDNFGESVSLTADGRTLVVGAPREGSIAKGVGGDQNNNNAENAGAAYMFALVDGTWLQKTYLKAGNTDANDAFGFSVNLSADGDTLAIGAPNESSSSTGINGDPDNNQAEGSGAVYIY
ncbi:FG-GAP repeat protein [Microbulbifer sp. VAAC004]|uniref:FG-GAP repeat protein n=1 Tax=unclassified Microbulbifer TaxID=2619833 RepID=UPI00403AE3A0